MSITREIKDFALDIGYSKVGMTSADRFQDHIDEVRSRGEIYDYYVADPRQLLKGAQPKEIMPSARSIISLAWDYAEKAFPEPLLGKVGRIYQARCYNAPPNRINGARYQLMSDFLTKMGCQIGSSFDELRWPKPLRPGDELHVETEILEIKPSKSRPELGFIKVKVTALNQAAEAVQIYIGNLAALSRSHV
jgi:hypothetical protein